jgi:hypothetical protein
MPRINRIFLTLVLVLAAIPLVKLFAVDPGARVTVMEKVTPTEARPGDVVKVTGTALGADRVKEVYLTDGANDFIVEIVEQNNDAIRFKVPMKISSGWMRLAIVVATRDDLLEEPVSLRILPAVGG